MANLAVYRHGQCAGGALSLADMDSAQTIIPVESIIIGESAWRDLRKHA
jgi:hypothetical protein